MDVGGRKRRAVRVALATVKLRLAAELMAARSRWHGGLLVVPASSGLHEFTRVLRP